MGDRIPIRLSPAYMQRLQAAQFPVDLIMQEIDQTGNPRRTLHNWTSDCRRHIQEGMWNADRDEILPFITTAIHTRLQPWIDTGTVTDLPVLSLVEIERDLRRTNGQKVISPERIVHILFANPQRISIGGIDFVTSITPPDLPQNSLGITESRKFGISPKQIAKKGRHPSYTPNSAVICKSRLDAQTINSSIRSEALRRTEISFVPVRPERRLDNTIHTDIQPVSKLQTPEEIIMGAENGEIILEVYRWFETMGGKKRNWIKGSELLFADKLIRLSQGESVDFLIWNCFGFEWEQEKRGDYPAARVVDNLDTAITYYFRERISEMMQQLAMLGNPQVIILVPTNELLADGLGIWDYAQPKDERERLLADTIASFQPVVDAIEKPPGVSVQVMRWDDYLKLHTDKSQNEYTKEGVLAMRSQPHFDRKVQKAAIHAQELFKQFGVSVQPSPIIGRRQIAFFGVYAGEGIALQGNEVVVVNFEEGSVRSAEVIGASGNIAIVTPATQQEITKYYQWKRETIAKRRNK